MNFVREELADLANPGNLFEVMSTMPGETYRQVASRRTFRFGHAGQDYFAKVHYGVGWKEILKNLVQFRLPVLGAANEYEAIVRLQDLDILTMKPVAYASEGGNPATRRSCIVTAALSETLSLEDMVLQGRVDTALRRRLVRLVAKIASRMHEGGVNHRDLYICHFHLDLRDLQDAAPRLHVIDLHRAQVRNRTPRRWVVKDVGGLFFSAFDAGLTRTDLLRFVAAYSGKPARRTLKEDAAFWRAVCRRAVRLYRAEQGQLPAHVCRWLGWRA